MLGGGGGGGGTLKIKSSRRVASRRPPSCSVYIWSATKYGTEAPLRTADQTRDSDYSKFPELKYFGMSSSVFHPFCETVSKLCSKKLLA